MRACDVILAAGGSGRRFGGETNKVLVPWRGRPLLWYSLALFGAHPTVRRIVIPCRSEDEEAIRELTEVWKDQAVPQTPEILLTRGGAERKGSVYRALLLCREELVLIHDGARPFATAEMIDACLEALETYPAASVGVLSKDTVKLVNEENEVISTTDRSRTWLIQTPQGFHRPLLLGAHEAFPKAAVTDDCALMELAGHPVKIVPGAYENIKITTQGDLE